MTSLSCTRIPAQNEDRYIICNELYISILEPALFLLFALSLMVIINVSTGGGMLEDPEHLVMTEGRRTDLYAE